MLGRFGNLSFYELCPKILTLKNFQIYLEFCSLIRIFALDYPKTN